MSNLVGNALKFTRLGHVQIAISVSEAWLQIDVRDTGIGISAEQLERLFKRFEQADVSVTRQFGGSGLGLYISKRWVEALGGALEVESVLGEGSCFSLRVPLATQVSWIESREAAADAGPEALIIPRLTGKELVVDDVEDLRDLITQAASVTGVHCETASNGAEAVERALAQPFDLILLDKHMPVLDGYSAMRQLRQSGCTAVIVALTADVLEHEAADDSHGGFDARLAKPLDRGRLYEVLAKFLSPAPAPISEAVPAASSDDTPQALAVRAAFAQLRARYGGRLIEESEALQHEMSRLDLDALKLRLHTLKGSAGTFGFAEVSAAAAEVEAVLKQGESFELQELQALLAPVIEAMRAAGGDIPPA